MAWCPPSEFGRSLRIGDELVPAPVSSESSRRNSDRAISESLVRDFLSRLEQEEAKLLTWGVIDGGFSLPDLELRAEEFLADRADAETATAGELVEAMLARRLVFDLIIAGRRVYRTRMAEAIRLFARLRQIFKFSQWRSGRNLVSDFRFALRPRVYPRRDVSLPDAVQAWQKADLLTPSRRRLALDSLMKRPGLAGLAGFQVRATERMFRDLDSAWSRGMIVTVGTGSGKTLAFYLPALAQIATLIGRDDYWTKAVAIYPRNELLKDQFSDTYLEARRLDGMLVDGHLRKIAIGAFFGATPNRASAFEVKRKKWPETSGGFACPFLRCPTSGCIGQLIWTAADLAGGVERLNCSVCRIVISSDEIMLTRARMATNPPDLLFTTTEMLNRVTTDSYNQHVFGIRATKPPQMVLLDEVHTYSGTHGAQVALLLRRWRHSVRARMQFTGLSATLRSAPEFFCQLVGLSLNAVEEITPTAEELEREGMEYLVALRGDPVSKTSLLSTSIQATMLLGRVLDPRRDHLNDEGPSAGAYGRKVFVFTDDLDVTNRLYNNLQDAEGVDGRGQAKPGREPLAALRSRGNPETAVRLPAGQSWAMCEEIGHPEGLKVPLVVGRTSSQDTGVDRDADAIVATASLEVGYNDPDVGAVLQHKAPYDAATFLQRRGRAGRLRTMRPWTVVVLSDYGRDRLAYQAYDSLFDPALEARALPVANRYVLRMQAVFALMDWLSLQLPQSPKGNVYSDFSEPSSRSEYRSRQDGEAALINRLLQNDSDLQLSLERHLSAALQLEEPDVAALLWDPPRSLMMHVLPTLLRRLSSQWHRVPLQQLETEQDYTVPNHPLPDFIPGNLFSDLNLPEVEVAASGAGERDDTLPVLSALRTLAPGRVTRRFAVGSSYASHWIQPFLLSQGRVAQDLEVQAICAEYEGIGTFQFSGPDGSVQEISCVRPWKMTPTRVPANVSVTSNAFLRWRTQLIPSGVPTLLEIPSGSEWAQILTEIRFYGHVYRSHVEARRFATGSSASIRWEDGRTFDTEIRFVDRETRGHAGVGFISPVDGLQFVVPLPEQNLVSFADTNLEKAQGFRTSYFKHLVLSDETLDQHANQFMREWLYQIYLSALTAWAVAESTTLAIAAEQLAPGTIEGAARKVLDVIFESLDSDEAEGSPIDGRQTKLRDEVLALFANHLIVDRLRALAVVLWEPPDLEWNRWAQQRYLATLGAALVEACAQSYPEATASDLLIDIDPGVRIGGEGTVSQGYGEIWITESTMGGGGVLEEVSRRYAEDPRRFLRFVESALGPSEHELVDAELTRTITIAQTDIKLSACLENVRAASQYDELTSAVNGLKSALTERGILVSHSVMVSLNARILRPGSNQETDALLRSLINWRREEEERLGIELDSRVFAYLASEQTELADALVHIDPEISNDRVFRFHALYGLLWPRGIIVRSNALSSYNPYAALPPTERLLVLDRLTGATPSVHLGSKGWRDEVNASLRSHGIVRLFAELNDRNLLRDSLLSLSAEPLEIDALLLYPQIEGVVRGTSGFQVALHLPEAIQ
jgi:hypothetical protein